MSMECVHGVDLKSGYGCPICERAEKDKTVAQRLEALETRCLQLEAELTRVKQAIVTDLKSDQLMVARLMVTKKYSQAYASKDVHNVWHVWSDPQQGLRMGICLASGSDEHDAWMRAYKQL